MTTGKMTVPSASELRSAEIRAHELRARVMRNGLAWIFGRVTPKSKAIDRSYDRALLL